MRKQAFYNGILYQIEYQPQLSNMDYTRHQVYHIKTEDENCLHVRRAIASVIEDKLGYKQEEIWSKGKQEEIKNRQDPFILNALHVRKAIVSVIEDKQEEIKNRQDPFMLNALHVYCKSLYNEGLDVYVYTFVRPYDD